MATQDTAENYKDRLLAAEQRLLAEGVPAYLDAIMALRELQQNVQKRCRQILCEGLEEFARAIGMPLNATMIKDYIYPDKISESATADWIWLGVSLPLQNAGDALIALVVVQKKDGKDYQSPVINGGVAVEFKDRNLFDRVWERVEIAEPRVVSDYRGIMGLSKPVPPDRIPSFVDILSDLLGEWSRLWQRVGGLQGTAMAR